jgi:hypothetical protein
MAAHRKWQVIPMRYTFPILAVLVLAGCTSTRVVDSSAPMPYAEVNEQAQRRTAQMQLADGRTMRATYLRVDRDSASYVDGMGDVRSIATSRIVSVRFTRHGRGALQGIGIGLLSGGGGGALVGLMSSTTCGKDDWFCGPGFNAAVFGVFFGAIGGAIGLVTGTARGHRTVYRFNGSRGPSPTRNMPEATGARPPH